MKRLVRAPIAVALVALCLLALPLAFIWLHLTSPFDGARLGPDEPFTQSAWTADGILATPLQDEPDGMRKNDLIIAVDGNSVQDWVAALTSPTFKRPQWEVGQTVNYTVVRSGTRLDVPVRLRAYPLGAVLGAAGTFPVSVLVFQFVMLYIFWRRPDDEAVGALAVCASCGASLFTCLSIGLQMSDIVGG